MSTRFLAEQSACRASLRFCMVLVMATEWQLRSEALEKIRQSLNHDPTNLDLANRYWAALEGDRSGGYAVVAYRGAALASGAGVAAFARACRELFDDSGESPQLANFDQPLINTLRDNLSELRGTDCDNVQWILQSIGVKPPST